MNDILKDYLIYFKTFDKVYGNLKKAFQSIINLYNLNQNIIKNDIDQFLKNISLIIQNRRKEHDRETLILAGRLIYIHANKVNLNFKYFLNKTFKITASYSLENIYVQAHYSSILLFIDSKNHTEVLDILHTEVLRYDKVSHLYSRVFVSILFQEKSIYESDVRKTVRNFILNCLIENNQERDKNWLDQLFITGNNTLKANCHKFFFENAEIDFFENLNYAYKINRTVLYISFALGNKNAIAKYHSINKEFELTSNFHTSIKWLALKSGYNKSKILRILYNEKMYFHYLSLLKECRTEEIKESKYQVSVAINGYYTHYSAQSINNDDALNVLSSENLDSVLPEVSLGKILEKIKRTKHREGEKIKCAQYIYMQYGKKKTYINDFDTTIEILRLNIKFKSIENNFKFRTIIYKIILLNETYFKSNYREILDEIFKNNEYISTKESMEIVLNYFKFLLRFDSLLLYKYFINFVENLNTNGTNAYSAYLQHNSLFIKVMYINLEYARVNKDEMSFIKLISQNMFFGRILENELKAYVFEEIKNKDTGQASIDYNTLDLIN